MLKLSPVIKAILDVIGFVSLPRSERRVTFYCEGKNYWPHLEGLVQATLKETNLTVCYLCSSLDDSGLQLDHPRFKPFFIGHGFIRDYIFQTLDTDIMVMTMPDLHQYQIKRSRHKVHYVYVQHSLVSLHMIYRHGAFDYFDTICCAGPHHVKEVRAIEATYNLPRKRIIELGYSRLDSIIRSAKRHASNDISIEETRKHKRILIAPSWGENGLVESGLGLQIVNDLLLLGHEVILRPHPQTLNLSSVRVYEIVSRHRSNSFFSFEDNVAGQDSLHYSDMMISDWSGAAIEYAFALNKPVIFCDVPRKVNNPNFKDINITPLEVSIRESIGVVWDGHGAISESIDQCNRMSNSHFVSLTARNVFNIMTSDQMFALKLQELV